MILGGGAVSRADLGRGQASLGASASVAAGVALHTQMLNERKETPQGQNRVCN